MGSSSPIFGGENPKNIWVATTQKISCNLTTFIQILEFMVPPWTSSEGNLMDFSAFFCRVSAARIEHEIQQPDMLSPGVLKIKSGSVNCAIPCSSMGHDILEHRKRTRWNQAVLSYSKNTRFFCSLFRFSLFYKSPFWSWYNFCRTTTTTCKKVLKERCFVLSSRSLFGPRRKWLVSRWRLRFDPATAADFQFFYISSAWSYSGSITTWRLAFVGTAAFFLVNMSCFQVGFVLM